MPARYTVTPERFAQVTRVALVMLMLIVLTGAGVRLTGSGLGCPTWPKCTQDSLHTELNTHGVIEFGNRMLSGFVGLVAMAAFVASFRRRPFRRDLMLLALALPLGVVAQAVLGGFTVLYHLAPGFVMSHYLLSMVILVAAVALDRRSHRPEDARGAPIRPAGDRTLVTATRALLPFGIVTLIAGTAATAAGPHAGGSGTGNVIHRLHFKGADTLNFVIHQHGLLATLFGLASVGVWMLARRRDAAPALRAALTRLCLLIAAQGVVGTVQYELQLPAEIVWVHVGLAATTWVTLLWAVDAAGSRAPAVEPLRDRSGAVAARG